MLIIFVGNKCKLPLTGQNKGRSIVGGSRTASVLLSKPAKLHESRVAKDKISSSPPTIEASAIESDSTAPTTEDDLEVLDEESTGRSGTLRGLRPRPSSGQVEIEGSLVVLDESPSFNSAKSKIGLTERLNKPARRSRLSSASVEVKGTGSVVSMFPLMHSQVDVSSRVDIRIGGAKVINNFFFFFHYKNSIELNELCMRVRKETLRLVRGSRFNIPSGVKNAMDVTTFPFFPSP